MIKDMPELQAYMRELSAEEFSELERNILECGIIEPLAIWRRTDGDYILDGRHRLKIAMKHKLKFDTITISSISSINDARLWMYRKQAGRRNLSPAEHALIRGSLVLDAPSAQGQRPTSRHGVTKSEIIKQLSSIDGVDKRTIQRDAQFAKSVRVIEQAAGPSAVEKVTAKNPEISRQDTVRLAKAVEKSPEDVAKVFTGEKTVKEVLRRPQPERIREPMLPKTSIVNDDLPGITEEWIRSEQWKLNILIMRKLTGESEVEARKMLGRLIHDCTQSAVAGAMAIAGNNLNFIKSEKLKPYAYIKAIASRIRLAGNGREGQKLDKNWELINRMIEERKNAGI
ncbi:MAG: hypothetical protein L0229_20435 [Blastocatellia bacterium]|nr:hypothetical protein [Blastocatellia bacterium]